MSFRNELRSEPQNITNEKFLEEATKLNLDTPSRFTETVLKVLKEKKVFIDIHAHCFTHRNVPANFLKVRIVKVPHRFFRSKLAKWIASVFPAPRRGEFAFLSMLAYTRSNLISRKLAFFYQQYLNRTGQKKPLVLVMLSMHMEVGISQNIPDKFTQQLVELEKSCRSFERTARIFQTYLVPFLAIDPNGSKAYQTFIQKMGNSNAKYPFAGIKIYPSLGYLPSHPVLMNIFAICAENKIPITTHCGSGTTSADARAVYVKGLKIDEQGIVVPITANEEGLEKELKGNDDYESFFNNPANWEPVLETHKNLRLNLAHFGSDDHWEAYLKDKNNPKTHVAQTLRLVDKYTHVFADISYALHNAQVLECVIELMGKNEKYRNKFLFGSDYYLVTRGEHMTDMMNNFHQVFKDHPIFYRKLTEENPKRFLLSQE